MAVHVLVTTMCKEDARHRDYLPQIENLKARVERDQHTKIFLRYSALYLKKRFERQIRLIALERRVGDHTVVCFLRLLVRGHGEYAQFIASDYNHVPGANRFEQELTDEALQAFVDARTEPLPDPPPVASIEEQAYLEVRGQHGVVYADWHACETQGWVEAMQRDEFAGRLALFPADLLDTLDAPTGEIAEKRLAADQAFGFLYRADPESKRVVLLTPFRGPAPLDEARAHYADILGPGPVDDEAVLRRTRRAYPFELLLNPDAWFEVERDREANMALSLEEVEVLEREEGFPLFINGRAGSGKSTILQYLFSEYLYHHLTTVPVSPPPLFFACNDELLARAKACVRNLVCARARAEERELPADELRAALQDRVQGPFRNFYESLLELAPSELFPTARRMDYRRFKRWWRIGVGRRGDAVARLGAGLAWHVIRTYIKGTDPEGWLEPDDYAELPEGQKTVTQATFQTVFEHVWTRYRQEQEGAEGFWDHQDLGRYLLENDLLRAEHPALFCDEAQDFTRIELEILSRLCLFGARRLQTHQLGRVPIAFAGDPFQTINPTGFKWETTKAFFTEKFLRPELGGGDRVNYRELTYNYRSSRNIVQFCNSLQLVRRVAFDIPEVQPQVPWDDDDAAPSVVYFAREDPGVLEALQTQSEIRIVVPCEEGAEGEWARDNGLADCVDFDDAGVPKNVVSPSRVKGLEFPRVVMYGFGGACPAELARAIADTTRTVVGDGAIEPQYFLNNLYVAASRPRKRLFIVDYRAHIASFWQPIFSEGNQAARANRTPVPDAWLPRCGTILQGTLNSWQDDQESPEATGRTLAEAGRHHRDAFLLRQAAQSFGRAASPGSAKRCRAEALEIEGADEPEKLVQAAELWAELNDLDRSVIAAWGAGERGRTFLLNLGTSHERVRNAVEYKVAAYLANGTEVREGEALLYDLSLALGSADRDLRRRILTEASWADAIDGCIRKLLGATCDGALLGLVSERIEDLVRSGVRVEARTRGEVAYRGGRMSEAVELWERIDPEARRGVEPMYLRAKVSALPLPDCLPWFAELHAKHPEGIAIDAERLLQRVEQERTGTLAPSHQEIVVRANLALGRWAAAAQSLNGLQDRTLIQRIAGEAARNRDAGIALAATRRLAEVLAAATDWGAIVALLVRGEVPTGEGETYAEWLSQNADERRGIVARLLAERRLVKATPRDKKELSSLLLSGSSEHDDVAGLNPLQVGAAIELAGVFVDALQYYERLRARATSDKVRDAAAGRWLYTKRQQGEWERERGQQQRAYACDGEALQKSIEWRVAFPSDGPEAWWKRLETEKIEPKRGYATDVRVGNVSVRISPDGTRVNLEHAATLEQASFRVSDDHLRVEGRRIPLDRDRCVHYRDWGMVLNAADVAKGRILVACNKTEVAFDVAPAVRGTHGGPSGRGPKPT
ncbi:MAG: hypothetical protein KIS66_02560 [Fimbriimonadaceae bacterium]|nr:hypothetical protein [Fimbriimonadaceae bacterium]